MNQRRLDLALLVGIGVLLAVILGLALSGAPLSAAGDISDPVDRVTAVDADAEAEAEPEATSGETSAQAEPGTATVAEAVEAVTEGETAPVRTDEADAATVADAAAALPVGSVPLERIGFAYATGSEGACGVPLTAWGHVAVSRDLLAAYPCGTAVTLTLDDEIAGRREVTAQVGDTMGADIVATVNIFVGQDEPALEYGVTSGALSQ
jgi:3D (Asp-Asp-Asp) domain-containing protein